MFLLFLLLQIIDSHIDSLVFRRRLPIFPSLQQLGLSIVTTSSTTVITLQVPIHTRVAFQLVSILYPNRDFFTKDSFCDFFQKKSPFLIPHIQSMEVNLAKNWRNFFIKNLLCFESPTHSNLSVFVKSIINLLFHFSSHSFSVLNSALKSVLIMFCIVTQCLCDQS